MSKTKYAAGTTPNDFLVWKSTNKDALIENFPGEKQTHEFADFCEFEHSRFLKRHLENQASPTP